MEALTDELIEATQADLANRVELRDHDVAGLSVVIGKRSVAWYLRYWEAKKRCRTQIGSWPVMAADQARQAAKAFKVGQTPTDTVEHLLPVYIGHLKRKGLRTVPETSRVLTKHLLPAVGNKKPEAVKRSDLVKAFETIKGKASANRFLALTRAFFNHLVDRGVIEPGQSPVYRLGALGYRERPRDRVLTDGEMRLIWGSAGLLDCPAYFGSIVKLLMLTGLRRGEAAALKSASIEHGNHGAWAVLPGALMKNGRPHRVWLTEAALGLVSGLAVPSGVSWSRYSRCLWSGCGISGATLHDIRRTVATKMQEFGVAPHVIERCLAHQKTGVQAVYQRHHYDDEARDAWDLVSRWIEGFEEVVK